MLSTPSNPLWRPLSILLAALSLSIGWGIRGNYGHEIGAMFPGALTAIAVCLLSGREDWRRRVCQFALFGMLGWGFGGSISYMQVVGYAHSGHSDTQLFGFGGTFIIGFLWAALGGAGTALPAVMDRRRLDDIFKPLTWLLMIWVALRLTLFPMMIAVQRYLELDGLPAPSQRQEQGLYWLDSDWFTVLIVLGGILLFDLINRRFEKWPMLLACSAAGVAVGLGAMYALVKLGWTSTIYAHLVQHQGVFEDRFTAEQLAVTNWPPIILHFATQQQWLFPGDLLGISLGLLLGLAVYFAIYGQFRCDSGLFLWMAVGWFAAFIALPVLGSLLTLPLPGLGTISFADYGGLRMTPPRGDNWAGVVGTFLGASIYFWRKQLRAVLLASIICGIIGGISFAGITWLQAMILAPGNVHISDDPAVQQGWTDWQTTTWEPQDWMDKDDKMPWQPGFIAEQTKLREQELKPWQHFRRQNWHSWLEQSIGFVNGLGVIIAMALLVTRVPPLDDETVPKSRWTEVVSITFALPALTYVNMYKNLEQWSPRDPRQHHMLPSVMKAPWVDFELSAAGWFNLFFAIATIGFIALLIVHTRRRLAIIPDSWIGRGQLLYFLLLWAFVLGNFTKALGYFGAGRLATEGVILINAVICTLLILILPRQEENVPTRSDVNFGRWVVGATLAGLLVFAAMTPAQWYSIRNVYGDANVGHYGGTNFRFGPNASWKRIPLIKGQDHR